MKNICKSFILLFALLASNLNAKDITFVDTAGRAVTLPEGGVDRAMLGAGRMVYAIASIFGKDANMFDKIVGMKSDLRKYDPDAYRKYLAKFPQLKDIPEFGSPYQADFSIEKAIAMKAQVVILNLGNLYKAQESGIISKLKKAGIETVFIDFREAPMRNTVPSLLVLGKVFGKQAKALEVIDFYITQIQRVTSKIALIKDTNRPTVFIENAAGSGWFDCCSTYGDTNMGRFINVAGGYNIASQLFGGYRGQISPEFLFKKDPDVIIGTGANWSEAVPTTKSVLLGYKTNKKDVQKRISDLANRKGWNTLKAVKTKRFYSIYHQFYNSPFNFVAIQHFAKAFYPKVFKDLDPDATFKEYHEKFLPVSYEGQFWAKYN